MLCLKRLIFRDTLQSELSYFIKSLHNNNKLLYYVGEKVIRF